MPRHQGRQEARKGNLLPFRLFAHARSQCVPEIDVPANRIAMRVHELHGRDGECTAEGYRVSGPRRARGNYHCQGGSKSGAMESYHSGASSLPSKWIIVRQDCPFRKLDFYKKIAKSAGWIKVSSILPVSFR
jgi:hypothetical protein